ncbi:YebC/PmpR family DNA-binding transcriptional regulator [Candidatus Nomurabacteria bacterium]|nr:YebC/PmpR family DNA-binding transcriptional regulator [Candidatus Nomurabacteria bacterium]
MSGHSKWHKIQNKKGKNDKARSAAFTKLLNGVTIAAQQGGGDVDMNFALRLAVQKAKAGNVPKDNIDRAIKRGTGESSDGVVFEEGLYEGFGPGGVAMLVETLTDNANRTITEVKTAFTKNGGSFGSSGSVSWQFEHLGVITVPLNALVEKNVSKDDFELAMMDAGMTDLQEDDQYLVLKCHKEDFHKLSEAVAGYGIEPEDSGLAWVAKEPIDVDDETMEKMGKLYEVLDESDDVREIYTNLR